jgi:hypothetical protein
MFTDWIVADGTMTSNWGGEPALEPSVRLDWMEVGGEEDEEEASFLSMAAEASRDREQSVY